MTWLTEWELEHPDGGTFLVPVTHYVIECRDGGVRIMEIPKEIDPILLIRRKWQKEEIAQITGRFKEIVQQDRPQKPRSEWRASDFWGDDGTRAENS